MEIISAVLEGIRLSSAIYFQSDFAAPWGMDIPKGPFAQFHMVTQGRCSLIFQEKEVHLFAGDIVVFPWGTNHCLADHPSSEKRNGSDVVQSILDDRSLFKGEDTATTLICGHFEFDRNFNHPFIKALPTLIHIKDAERREMSLLDAVSNLIIQETDSEKFGSDVLLRKLGEILFIHTLRAFIERNSSRIGFLAALQDEKIGKALNAIHNHPSKSWSLSSLAAMATTSRTGLSNRFKLLVGETPMGYITNWRVMQAKRLLKESDRSVGEIAENVGYRSEAAFNRVFKKLVAQTPLKYRKSVLFQ